MSTIVLHPDLKLSPTGTHVALEDIAGADPLRIPRAMRPSLNFTCYWPAQKQH